MNLHDFVHAPAVTCPAEASLVEVAQTMDRFNVGSVVLVDAGGTVVGIVTDRDLAVRAVARNRGLQAPVRDIMSTNVIMLQDDADLFDAAREMAESGCRRLPVIDAEGTLRGVVSLDDLMILFAHQADHLAQAVAAEATSPVRRP